MNNNPIVLELNGLNIKQDSKQVIEDYVLNNVENDEIKVNTQLLYNTK